MTTLAFEPTPPLHATTLSAVARQQLETYGERLDGERLSADARLDPNNDGAGLLFSPTRWKAVGPDGRAVFELVHSDTDSGAVFHADTTRLVGLIIQGGFTATDLAAWERLAATARPPGFPSIDFSIDPETGPNIAGKLAIGGAWRALRVVVAPWDPEGILTRLLTATSDEDAAGQTGLTGAPLASFSASVVDRIAAVLATVPRDAVDQRRMALATAISDEDDRTPSWLEEKLERLREVVQARAPLIVRVV
ncbi:MAG: hypothetical protein JNM17_37475 [Archangium sp.]|nr:hypothetical protein [Archangium sp.]